MTDYQVLADELERVQTQRNEARQRALNLENDLAAFRNQVRDVAIRVHNENDSICLSGLNDVLDELGLPKYATSYIVKGTIEYELSVNFEGAEDWLEGGDPEVTLEQFINDELAPSLSDYSIHSERVEITYHDTCVNNIEVDPDA